MIIMTRRRHCRCEVRPSRRLPILRSRRFVTTTPSIETLGATLLFGFWRNTWGRLGRNVSSTFQSPSLVCGSESKEVAIAHLSALANATILARAHYRRLELFGLDVFGRKTWGSERQEGAEVEVWGDAMGERG